MDRKSIVQEYFVLAINEKGLMSAMHREEAKAGVVVAGVMDLLLNGIIDVEKKKITVIKDLPEELKHIESLYTYLKEKPRSSDKLMRDYIVSAGNRLKKLTEEIGESLFAAQAVNKTEGGLFGNKTIYIPEAAYKEEVIENIRTVATKDGPIIPQDMILLCILKETKNLNSYFTDLERKKWKAKWNEIKNNPQNQQLAYMIHSVSDMTAILATVVLNGS